MTRSAPSHSPSDAQNLTLTSKLKWLKAAALAAMRKKKKCKKHARQKRCAVKANTKEKDESSQCLMRQMTGHYTISTQGWHYIKVKLKIWPEVTVTCWPVAYQSMRLDETNTTAPVSPIYLQFVTGYCKKTACEPAWPETTSDDLSEGPPTSNSTHNINDWLLKDGTQVMGVITNGRAAPGRPSST